MEKILYSSIVFDIIPLLMLLHKHFDTKNQSSSQVIGSHVIFLVQLYFTIKTLITRTKKTVCDSNDSKFKEKLNTSLKT